MLFYEWYDECYQKVLNAGKFPSDINLIIRSVLLGNRNDIDNYLKLSDKQITDLNEILNKYLTTDIPIGYLVGFEMFLDNVIKVTTDTLIPRFETEELVLLAEKKIRENYKTGSHLIIADVCCGTGVIGISLFNLLKDDYQVKVIFSDISTDALNVCQDNIKYHNIKDYQIFKSDLLDELINNNIKVDVLLSNPPYIDKAEQIEETVIKYEPHLALFAEDKGLACYKKMIDNFHRVIKDNGLIFFEIGYLQGPALVAYCEDYELSKSEVIKDINQKDRILYIKY